jgi:hypothetical protein
MPAMFSIEPFGFASGTIRPFLSVYRKITCSLAFNPLKVSASAKKQPSP